MLSPSGDQGAATSDAEGPISSGDYAFEVLAKADGAESR
jgi:hypothetical protein